MGRPELLSRQDSRRRKAEGSRNAPDKHRIGLFIVNLGENLRDGLPPFSARGVECGSLTAGPNEAR